MLGVLAAIEAAAGTDALADAGVAAAAGSPGVARSCTGSSRLMSGCGCALLSGVSTALERITSSTRRLALRPSTVSLVCIGCHSPSPITDRRFAATPPFDRRCTTVAARADDNSQLEGNATVLIGTLSVWPSTRTGLGYGASAFDNACNAGTAEGEMVETPLANRMSARISTSIQYEWRRTVTSSASTSNSSDFSTSSASFASSGGTTTLLRPSPMPLSREGPKPFILFWGTAIASSIWRG